MGDLLAGSMPSWLSAAATAVGSLIALLAGLMGTDRWLRWLPSENCQHASAGGDEGVKLRRCLALRARPEAGPRKGQARRPSMNPSH